MRPSKYGYEKLAGGGVSNTNNIPEIKVTAIHCHHVFWDAEFSSGAGETPSLNQLARL